MGHLSAVKFIKNNKKQVAVIVIALTLSVMGIYLIGSILASTKESFRPVIVEGSKRQMYLELSYDTLVKAGGEDKKTMEGLYSVVIEKLEQLPEVKKAFFSEWTTFSIKALLGNLGTEMPLLKPEDIPLYLTHMKSKLVDGRLPEQDFEIALDSAVMRNQSYKIGDKLGNNLWTIVGVVEGPYYACVGTTAHGHNNGYGLIILNEEGVSGAKELFEKIGVPLSNLDSISNDAQKGSDMFQKEVVDEIDGSLQAIILGTIFLLAVSVTVAYNSYMRNRVNEYCLYASLGYSRLEVYRMILREIAILFGAGIVLGFAVAGGMIALIDVFLMHPLGLIPVYIDTELIGLILASMAAVIGILQFPALLSVHRIRTIDMLED
ncbi:MAG: ABC transporter permease [Lachnospiraceae bacterium]|nr:ABC transporter permease [Lachnospiraceae bacterium]